MDFKILIGLLALMGMVYATSSDIEKAQFLGKYNQWYVGLEEGNVQDVYYQYHDHLIDSVKIECDYYIQLQDGTQLKVNKSHHAKNLTCKYQQGDTALVEVWEDSLGNKEYRLIGID